MRWGQVCCGAVRDGAGGAGDGGAVWGFWGRCIYLPCVMGPGGVGGGDVRERRMAVHGPTCENRSVWREFACKILACWSLNTFSRNLESSGSEECEFHTYCRLRLVA